MNISINKKTASDAKQLFFPPAVPTGFEPAISALTGQRVKPSYTTGPFDARKSILLYIPSDVKANLYVGIKIGYTTPLL
jgi:hypothetical protein